MICQYNQGHISIYIIEGDTKILYAMELVPPKDVGSIIHTGIWHYSLKVLALGMNVSALSTFQ